MVRRGRRAVKEETNGDEASSSAAHQRAVEVGEEDEECDYSTDENHGGGSRSRRGKRKSRGALHFIDFEAEVDDDEDEEEEGGGGGDDFIDQGADLGNEPEQRMCWPAFITEDQEEEEEDMDEIERQVRERYTRSSHLDYAEDANYDEQQAFLPSLWGPKLWLVKCTVGLERELAVRLMQKFINRGNLRICSVIALDHIEGFIYVEATKAVHVREACKGLRNIYLSDKLMHMHVPIKEMTGVLSAEGKVVDIVKGAWVRMRGQGIYEGDLAQVVYVNYVIQRATVKLVPRVDLRDLDDRMAARKRGEGLKTMTPVPPRRFFNEKEARNFKNLRMYNKVDIDIRENFVVVEESSSRKFIFKDGFLYKLVPMSSVSAKDVHPTIEELEMFEGSSGDASGPTLFTNRRKGHFMRGDAVVVIRGELQNLHGWVEKVEPGTVHIRAKITDLSGTLAVDEKDLCKFFNHGEHIKVVAGVHKGATGMVVEVESRVLTVLSDATKEHIHVFADHVVNSAEITTGVSQVGEYEMHDLVQLDNTSFGVVIQLGSEGLQVLKGVPDRPQVMHMKLGQIKNKIYRHTNAKDQSGNRIAAKDVVRVVEGPLKGKQGTVKHIHKGILFIHDGHHLEHAGLVCTKAESCVLVGGSNPGNRGDKLDSRSFAPKPLSFTSQSRGGRPPRASSSYWRLGGGDRKHRDSLMGKTVKIRSGVFKGYRGRVDGIKGPKTVRIELQSQMKRIIISRDHIVVADSTPAPPRGVRYMRGAGTAIHPSRMPLQPVQSPVQPRATPIHHSMRTPMRDYPLTPARRWWEQANPGGSSSHLRTAPAWPHDNTPTRGSGRRTGTSGGASNNYTTPRDSYANTRAPATPIWQPMTPHYDGMDVTSPMGGSRGGSVWCLPDIVVNVSRPGEDTQVGVIREVLLDGSYRVARGASGKGGVYRVAQTDVVVVEPKKQDNIKIMSGALRGLSGKLIATDGSDGVIRLAGSTEVKVLKMDMLAKFVA